MTTGASAFSWRVRWSVPPRTDVVLALALCALDTLLFSGLSGAAPFAMIVYALLGYVPLAWRRVAPRTVFTLVWLHHLGAAIWTIDMRPTLGLLVALYTVASMTRWPTSVVALVATLVAMAPAAAELEVRENPEDAASRVILFVSLAYTFVIVLTWGLGRWARASRSTIDDLEERRARAAAEAVRTERSRVARELHDIVSHSVSVMVLQAAGARRVLGTDPQRAEEALAHIEAIGKESMGELRRLLDVLSADRGEDEPVDAELGPQPGLANLDALLEGVRSGGLPVRFEVEGRTARLDPIVDLSAYRIVQEALTNTIKHGGAGVTATVRLRWTAEALVLEVTDDGDAATSDPTLSTQHGLAGMKERARAVGGQLEAGPIDGGGFRVMATLPTSSSSVVESERSVVHQG